MNDLCVILAMTAAVSSALGAGGAGAHEFHSERVIFADLIRVPDSAGASSVTQQLAFPVEINDGKVENYGGVARERTTGSVIIDSQYVRKPFMWPWASSPAQNSPAGDTQRSRGNRSGGSGSSGSSGSSNAGGGSTSGSGNMGSGSSTGSASGSGNMGSSGSGGSGNMK